MEGSVYQRVAVKQQQERSFFFILGLLRHHGTDAIITCLLISGLSFSFRHGEEHSHMSPTLVPNSHAILRLHEQELTVGIRP